MRCGSLLKKKMSCTYLEKKPDNILLPTKTKLVSCCPWKVQTVYIRKNATECSIGFCNSKDCWIMANHTHTNLRVRNCLRCNGTGKTGLKLNYLTVYMRCELCSGQGNYKKYCEENCVYCYDHCKIHNVNK